eukprot:3310022-Rhodomonas_salina.2
MRRPVHCEIKHKKTLSPYTLYQKCVFWHLISGRAERGRVPRAAASIRAPHVDGARARGTASRGRRRLWRLGGGGGGGAVSVGHAVSEKRGTVRGRRNAGECRLGHGHVACCREAVLRRTCHGRFCQLWTGHGPLCQLLARHGYFCQPLTRLGRFSQLSSHICELPCAS